MCRCYICDKEMTELSLDYRDMKTRPCSECEEVVNELVQDAEEASFTYIESEIVEYNEEVGTTDRKSDLGNPEW